MRYEVELTRKAEKALKKIDAADQRRIRAAIDGLAADPRPAQSRKLTGSDDYRLRVGTYRVIYAIQDARLRVLVLTVGHRRDVYRR